MILEYEKRMIVSVGVIKSEIVSLLHEYPH